MDSQTTGPGSVYCDGVWCHVLCLQHDIPVWKHIDQSTTASSRQRRDMTMFKSDVKPNSIIALRFQPINEYREGGDCLDIEDRGWVV